MSLASVYEWQMLNLINAERARYGLDPVLLETTLNGAAEDHTEWMIATDTFSHTGVGASNPGQRIVAAGFDFAGSAGWAENLAGTTVFSGNGYSAEINQLHQQLMNSSLHRANILNASMEFVGIGFEIGEYQGRTWAFVTQKYAFTDGTVSIDPTGIEDLEEQYQKDYDNNGIIGHYVENIDTSGVGLQYNTRDGYRITDGGTNVILTYGGNIAGPNSFPGYSAIQASSDGAGGYNVLWQHTTGVRVIWNVDATGAKTGDANMADIINYEAGFGVDLNGDGRIGHFVDDIETNGVGLQYNTRDGYRIVDGATNVILTYNGNVAGPNSFPGFSAISAGSDGAGGYSVLWQHVNGTRVIWNVDATGAKTGDANMLNLIDYEDRFDFDLNGDGRVGHYVEDIDTMGVGLEFNSRDGYWITDGGNSVILTYDGNVAGPNSFPGFAAVSAGSDGAGGYNVLWQHVSGAQVIWNVDASGAKTGDASMTNMLEFEERLDVDLDGDGRVGHFVESIDTTDVGLEFNSRDGYRITDGTDSVILTYDGKIAGPDSFPGFTAIQAGSDGAGGYSVLWQHTTGARVIWNVDATGAKTGDADMLDLIDYEDRFDFDLDGDGRVGHFVEDIDTTGVGLQFNSRDGYRISDGGDSHILTYDGNVAGPNSFRGFEAIEAGSDGMGGFNILWKHVTGALVIWNVDENGAKTGDADMSNLVDYEERFMVDLNGDLLIG